jgi:L-threonylcarbamoyladenylate synthase
LTLVVERAAAVPAALSGGKGTVAIRSPAHPVSRGLLAELGEPIAAPSANPYQSLSPTRAEHVVRSLGQRVALVLDGGPTALGLESTVVDLTRDRPTVLRPGALSLAALRAVLPDLAIASGITTDAERHSPGQDAVHYAPRAALLIVSRAEALARAKSEGERAAVVLRGIEPSAARHRFLPPEPEGFGRELFATLHDLDALGVQLILVEAPPEDEAWFAVRDRLGRASHSH